LLSIKLRWKEVYIDSLRHVLARGGIPEEMVMTSGSGPSGVLDLSYDNLYEHSGKLKDEQAPAIFQLHKDLHKLQLHKSFWKRSTTKYPVYITFFNMLTDAWTRRSANRKSQDRAEFLACAIYGQWLTEQEVGEYEWSFGRRKSKPSGPLSVGILALEEAAASDDPAALFGNDIPDRLISIFSLEDQTNPKAQIDFFLARIVREAAEIVGSTFRTFTKKDQDGVVWTYRRARFDVRARIDDWSEEGAFTFLPLDEEAVPWKSEEEWVVSGGVVPLMVEAAEEGYVAAILGL
jgi:hypothetical protein